MAITRECQVNLVQNCERMVQEFVYWIDEMDPICEKEKEGMERVEVEVVDSVDGVG